jgi:penicillin amidase
MHRFQRWASRLAKLLGLLLALALLAGAYYAWRASPRHQGLLQAPGLGAAVKIQRDAHGIPHIEAQSVSDLAFAVGFSHAQDRGWQLETQRRIGQGRLAEAFGASALETDRFLRVLGVHRVAQRQWDWLQTHGDPEARAALLAYCAGVNAGWRSQARPPEMLILGLSFEEWTPADSLAWGLMMAWDLGGNWNQELLRLRLALQLPAAPADERMQRINELMPAYPGDRLPALGNYLQLYAELGLGRPLDAKLEGLQAAAAQQGLSGGVEGAGSNNWALAASRSATGQPLLANDPHLKLQAPALWYLARLKAPGLQVAGGMLPGLPFITLGQNQRVAWAFTNTGPDTQDLYLEELKDGAPGQPAQVRTPAGWEPLSERVETLRIKGGGSEQLRVRSSRHGPLISDAGPGGDLLSVRGERRFALALRWAALEGEQDPLRVSLAINRAGSVDALQQALRGWHSPQQNMLLAEKDGDIASLAPGRVPVRRADNDLHGLLPAPGWEPRYDWQGLLPFEALPRERAPARGWLATANQKIHGADYPHHISHDWALPYRQQRIEQQLQARERHDLASLAALQADTLSLGAQPLLAAFKAARTPHRLAAALAPAVQAFDGQMKADSAAAALFWVWGAPAHARRLRRRARRAAGRTRVRRPRAARRAAQRDAGPGRPLVRRPRHAQRRDLRRASGPGAGPGVGRVAAAPGRRPCALELGRRAPGQGRAPALQPRRPAAAAVRDRPPGGRRHLQRQRRARAPHARLGRRALHRRPRPLAARALRPGRPATLAGHDLHRPERPALEPPVPRPAAALAGGQVPAALGQRSGGRVDPAALKIVGPGRTAGAQCTRTGLPP